MTDFIMVDESRTKKKIEFLNSLFVYLIEYIGSVFDKQALIKLHIDF